MPAATTNFFNYTREKVKNQKSGYRNRAWLAVVSTMTTISEPLPGSFGADAKTALTDHVFATGKGFMEVYCLPKSVEAPAESAGDTGAKHLNWKPKFFIPGDSPELQALVEEGLLNEDLVLLVEDATCPDGGVRQFGCDCTPLNVSDLKFESGNTGDGKKGWAVETETSCRYFYMGTILKQP